MKENSPSFSTLNFLVVITIDRISYGEERGRIEGGGGKAKW